MTESRQLDKSDVIFVGAETDRVYQHMAALAIFDSSDCPEFDFGTFRRHMAERVGLVPHFRWKLYEVPLGLDLPYWIEDEKFNIDHHLRRIAVPSPGDREALAEVASHLYSKHLDRSRPPWEIWFIEGLPDGQFAMFQKLHHCMMDGEGANKLGEIMCDFEPDAEAPVVDPAIANARAGAMPSDRELAVTAVGRLARLPWAIGGEILDAARPILQQRLTGGGSPKREKPPTPIASFNAQIGRERGFVFGSLPLEDIKLVKNRLGVSLNDVIMALVGSSMREYLLAQGALPQESLRAGIAVSVRNEGDDAFSNRVTSAEVTLGTDLEDAGERLRAIHAETGAAKTEARSGGKGPLEYMQMLPPLLVNALTSLIPPDQAATMMGANLAVSNVRGSPRPMYVAGARMMSTYPMSVITPGIGINLTCMSYAGQVDFGVTIEPELFPQPWEIIDGMKRALGEYLVLAGKEQAAAETKAPTKKHPATRASQGEQR